MIEVVNKRNLLHNLSTLNISIEDYEKVYKYVLNFDTIYVDNDKVIWYNEEKERNNYNGVFDSI